MPPVNIASVTACIGLRSYRRSMQSIALPESRSRSMHLCKRELTTGSYYRCVNSSIRGKLPALREINPRETDDKQFAGKRRTT